MARPAFPGVEMGMGRKRETRRSRFLDRLPESCPWDAWLALAGGPRGRRRGEGGRPRDGQAEDRRPRAAAHARGAGLLRPLRPRVRGPGLGLRDDALLRRRGAPRGPRRHDPARASPPARALRGRRGHGLLGLRVRRGRGLAAGRGTIADATLVEGPSPARNADGARDPDAHQAKKGQDWHFGHELGVGAGAGAGVPRSVRMGAANVHDLDQVPDLVREGGDASGTVPATSASGGGRGSPATPPSPASSGPSPRGARRSAGTTWSQGPPSRPPAASSSTSSTGSRTCSGCGRRATRGSPRCPTRPSPPSPQPAA